MKKQILLLVGVLLLSWSVYAEESKAPAAGNQAQASADVAKADDANAQGQPCYATSGKYKPDSAPKNKDITADHRKFDILHQNFKTAPEVTKACLSCHTEAGKQVMHTIHWKWICPKSKEKIGKYHVINNFCIAVPSNEPRCTSCHAGYGWKDKNFDFSNQNNIDCLACHDTTGTYKKFPTAAGHPVYEPKKFHGKTFNPPDLAKIAQNVGKTSRKTCGKCHFFGGGGDGVKHGDLDSSLFNPDKSLDVHMDAKGLNFGCTKCHTSTRHDIDGRCYNVPPSGKEKLALPEGDVSRITCESCHSNHPHSLAAERKGDTSKTSWLAGLDKMKILDEHTRKVACQTCHIPAFARQKPTKMWWDWSKAGKCVKDGKEVDCKEGGHPLVKKDKNGWMTYHGMKGEFRWEKNVVPEYYWFNWHMKYQKWGGKIDPTKVVKINEPQGSYDDPNAKIFPFKVHRGKQIYDAGNNTLVVPKLFGPKGSGAYWKDFDWKKSAEKGMAYVGLPFSGKVGFVKTEMFWPISHMVAPKEKALQCEQCHTRKNGRLANLAGFYMPGRDNFAGLDYLGWALVILSLIGVLIHGLMRIVLSGKRK